MQAVPSDASPVKPAEQRQKAEPATATELVGQATQATLLPAAILYVLTRQAVQAVPAAALPVKPALHVHALTAVDPVTVVMEPVGQAVHATLPAAALYELKAHAVQAVPAAALPVKPIAHEHAVTAVDPVTVVIESVVQALHAAVPVTAL